VNTLRAVLGNGALTRLELALVCSTLVVYGLAILVGLYAYRVGGAPAVGLVAVARDTPAALLAPRLALVADRGSRRRVLGVGLLIRIVLTAVLAVVILRDGSLLAATVLAAAWAVVDTVHRPAVIALMASVARTPGELGAANALLSMAENAGFLVASVTVAVVVAGAGLGWAFAACVVPLLVALVALAGVPADQPMEPLDEPGVRDDLLAGMRTIQALPKLRMLVGLDAGSVLVQGMLGVMLVVIAVSLLDLGEPGAGWLNAAWGVGGIAGGMVAAALLARHRLPVALRWGLVLSGVPLVLLGLWPHVAWALTAMVAVGVGFGMFEASVITLGQRLVPADVMARVYGVQETLEIVAAGVGAIAASALIEVLGQRGALAVIGAVLPLTSLVLWRRMGQLHEGATTDERGFTLLRAVPAFASLPVASVETLVARSHRTRFGPGTDIVRQGAQGDAFFVIESGEVEVVEDDRLRRVEGPGDHFGEIALLHDVPRTATVRARGTVDLLVLERAEFRAAVGAHHRLRRGMEDVARERLGDTPAD
jgi:hypothetical protein